MDYVLHEALQSLWIVLPILAVFVAGELLYHLAGVSAELTRKLSHVGAGLVTLGMPWVADTHWTVLGMAAVFTAGLGLSRPLGLLKSVHAVERRTRGAHYYPFAVWITFALTGGDPWLFGIATLVMALSDTAAALVGRRHGLVRYRVIDEDYRSLGGSLTLFALTFALILGGLSLRNTYGGGHLGLPEVLTVSFIGALVSAAIEAVSVRGLDNLLLPYGVVLVFRRTLDATRAELGEWIFGGIVVLGALMLARRIARLDAAGLTALFVTGFLTWGLAGPVWCASMAVPFAGFVASRWAVGARYELDLRLVGPAFAVTMGVVLVYGHSGASRLYVPFVASIAATTALVWTAFVHNRWPSLWREQAAALLGAGVVLVPSFLLATPTEFGAAESTVAVGTALAAPPLVRLQGRVDLRSGRARAFGVLLTTAAAFLWLLL